MGFFRSKIGLFALFPISVSFLYLWSYYADPVGVFNVEFNDDQWIITSTNVGYDGFVVGDRVLSINGKKYGSYYYTIYETTYEFGAGETVFYKLIRNKDTLDVAVTLKSYLLTDLDFYLLYYFLIFVVIAIGYYVLQKKSDDAAAIIFFFFTQIFAVCLNSTIYITPNITSIIRNGIFMMTFPFLGSSLIHFFMCYPTYKLNLKKYKGSLYILYAISLVMAVSGAAAAVNAQFNISEENYSFLFEQLKLSVLWMSSCLSIALILGVVNYFTQDKRNRKGNLRWLLIGIIFGLLPETLFGFFNEEFQSLDLIMPHLVSYVWAFGAVILVSSLTFSMLKYKLWKIEVAIKRSLVFTFTTVIVIGIYLFLIYLIQDYAKLNSYVLKIFVISISALIFLPLREFFVSKLEKIFHRENYDPATAVLKFENRIYSLPYEDLSQRIGDSINEIFHFKALLIFKYSGSVISLEYDNSSLGQQRELPNILQQYEASEGLIPAENFYSQIPLLSERKIQYIFPIENAGKVFGYLFCGEKKSELVYSLQDINLLKLLANASATFFQLFKYKNEELIRKLEIQNDRLRISKDMHDEIGSSLTQISILSEVIKNNPVTASAREQIEKIANISRRVIDNISEIIWAINPSNDELENLIGYLREVSTDYLEGTNIKLDFTAEETNHEIILHADKRRSIFLTVKEALNNIVKHSKATNVKIDFFVNDSNINVKIADDGIGCENDNPFGYGLKNMRSRIEELNGNFDFESISNKGTFINFSIPHNN